MDVTNSEEYKRVQRREAAQENYRKKIVSTPVKSTFLRVIGGELRARKILFKTEASTRPMKDRTREAIFNLLQKTIQAKIAIDLFAGTGILAFESLSRGAYYAVAIEKQAFRANEIAENAKRITIDQHVRILQADAFRVSNNPSKLIESLPVEDHERAAPWAVFCCPPYSFWTEKRELLTEMIDRYMQQCPVDSLIIIELESATADQFMFEADNFEWDRRSYHPATIAIGTKLS